MSDSGSKFGIFGKLKETTEERDIAKAQKQKSTKAQKTEPAVLEKMPEPAAEVTQRHYSSYMPADLYHELQAYVVKLKSERQPGDEKPSVQAVIVAAVRAYLKENK